MSELPCPTGTGSTRTEWKAARVRDVRRGTGARTGRRRGWRLIGLCLAATVLTLTWTAPAFAGPPAPLHPGPIRPVPLRPVSPTGEQPRIARDRLAYRVHPGETAAGSIHVSNDSQLPASITLIPVDAVIARDGNVLYRPPLAPRKDVGAWIALRTTTLKLRPGEGR